VTFYLYILHCAGGSYYTGHTDNLEPRLAAHSADEFHGYTAGRQPLRLQFVEAFPSRLDALERAQQIKRWSREKKPALIHRDWPRLQALARAHGWRPPVHGSTGSPRTGKEISARRGNPTAAVARRSGKAAP